jgi:Kef-type K+ transport system membrane component KefB
MPACGRRRDDRRVDANVGSLFIVLVAAALAPLIVDLPRRVRVPAVVAEITLGILIGPQLLGFAEPAGVVDFLSDVGLVFLFFLGGMEIDFERIRGAPARLAGAGWLLSIALALGTALLLEATGFVVSAVLVGVALSTTAIGTLMPALRDAGELNTPLGPFVLAAGVAGEFCPLLVTAIVLTGGRGPGVAFALLLAFLAVSALAALVALRARPPRFVAALRRTMHTSGQVAVRAALVVLFALVLLARDFGFDIVLGAFAAGLIVGLTTKSDEAQLFRDRLEGIGFGFVIPIFFVVTGMKFDLEALFASPVDLLRVPVFLALFLLARGVPAFLLYRGAVPSRDRLPLALYSATALPLVVAVTTIGLETGHMHPENAAALVGAAMLSVLVFPLLALRLRQAALATAQAPRLDPV